MSSILTNNGAMNALQTLRSINSSMSDLQNQISTGKQVSSSSDSAAIWNISKVMEADQMQTDTLKNNIGIAKAATGVAKAASEEIVSVMEKVYDKITTATTDGVDHATIQDEVDALMAQVGDIIASAQFNGENLLSTAGDDVELTPSVQRQASGAVTTSELTIANVDLEAALSLTAGTVDVTDAGTARDTLVAFETNMDSARAAAASFGVVEQRLDSSTSFLENQSASLKSGIGAMVDADMEEVSARLQALQVQQQLGVQALSIANQQPQQLLSLFR